MSEYIRNVILTSNPAYSKLPKNVPNLKKISIWFYNTSEKMNNNKNRTRYNIQSFKDLPEKLPNLESIEFHKSNIPKFDDLPKKLPNLKNIEFNNSNITNFENLTAEMPKLKWLSFSDCRIHNFLGFPSNIGLSAHHTQITSFEGLNLPVPHDVYMDENSNTLIKENLINLTNCTIRSLGGVSRSTLQALLIAILSKDYPPSNPKYPKKNKLDLHPTGFKLIQKSINHEIERRYSPKYHKSWPRIEGQSQPFPEDLPLELRSRTCIRIPDFFVNDWKLFHSSSMYNRYEQMELHAQKNDWIYGFNLMDRLFIPEKLDRLYEYFKKTTQQLAQDYITAPESIPPEQIERLVHEINPKIRKILENNLPPSDSIIKRISTKFSFRTENGLTLLK
ncbi:hypothetical protein DSAG12_01603 [Promethearchaeum syntrophicum]|uniref:Leucine Rich repeats (2 copies) n=1 Tax=Promethearchaeum syntrophicum TaxID=2594042 RepID=A0A5B9DAY9_9ARCH|nr:hypothetical protein [Candidatus Prometheoarchaeum syntrophicum]QEE15776.1 hypothetical protein DSAG12_01603 [Candidatus Prometheoarchaeum syntrophicum]